MHLSKKPHTESIQISKAEPFNNQERWTGTQLHRILGNAYWSMNHDNLLSRSSSKSSVWSFAICLRRLVSVCVNNSQIGKTNLRRLTEEETFGFALFRRRCDWYDAFFWSYGEAQGLEIQRLWSLFPFYYLNVSIQRLRSLFPFLLFSHKQIHTESQFRYGTKTENRKPNRNWIKKLNPKPNRNSKITEWFIYFYNRTRIEPRTK